MMGCKQVISFWNETSCYRKTEISKKAKLEDMSSRIDPSIGANRSIYQTALRCFSLTEGSGCSLYVAFRQSELVLRWMDFVSNLCILIDQELIKEKYEKSI
jgi:hypothetical protein